MQINIEDGMVRTILQASNTLAARESFTLVSIRVNSGDDPARDNAGVFPDPVIETA
jgi:hypothetical protein